MDKSVIVIDDSRDIQVLLKGLLESEGYEVLTAINGLEALQILKHSKHLPSLILLDLMMPVMDGSSFIKEFQKVADYHDVKVVLMSADNKYVEKNSSLKAYNFIKKPFDIDQLLEAVEGVKN